MGALHPKSVSFFRLQVYKRVSKSQVIRKGTVGKSAKHKSVRHNMKIHATTGLPFLA